MVQDKNSLEFKDMHLKDIPKYALGRITGKNPNADNEMVTGQTGKYEVNLVPAVKMQMIQMQKTRNLVFFICIVISVICGSVVAVMGSIHVGQQVSLKVQSDHLEKLSETVTGYGELSEFLTIQNQVNKMTEVENNRKVLSRVFGILNVMLPSKDDTVKLSELNVNLSENQINFDAQADAGKEPFIDYRVLESFKKQVEMMKYDTGRYVDVDGREIPTRCMIETDANGNLLSERGSIYAIWKRGETGCDPGRDDYSTDDDGNIQASDYTIWGNSSSSIDNTKYDGTNAGIGSVSGGVAEDIANGEETKLDDGETVVAPGSTMIDIIPDERIYRTPQFTNWYEGTRVTTAEDGIDDDVNDIVEEMRKADGIIRNVKSYIYNPKMKESKKNKDGELQPAEIDGIPHFESQCISYYGVKQEDGSMKWTAENSCKMISDDGMTITDSSNGLDQDQNLILQFSALIVFDEGVFAFKNKHMTVITPNSQNVTDSYKQIEDMFTAPATECKTGDKRCDDKGNAGE